MQFFKFMLHFFVVGQIIWSEMIKKTECSPTVPPLQIDIDKPGKITQDFEVDENRFPSNNLFIIIRF